MFTILHLKIFFILTYEDDNIFEFIGVSSKFPKISNLKTCNMPLKYENNCKFNKLS